MNPHNTNDHKGVKVNGHNITNLRHADNFALIASSDNELQLTLNSVAEGSSKRG